MRKITIVIFGGPAFFLFFLSSPAFSIPLQLSDFSSAATVEGFDGVSLLSPIPDFSDFSVFGDGGVPTAVNDTVPGLTGDFIPTSAPIVVGMDGQGITSGKSVHFVFNRPLSQLGLQFIDVESFGATLTIFDRDGLLLENIAVMPQAQSGQAQFYGFENLGIRRAVVGTASGEGIAVDDLRYTVAVPEPSSVVLLGSGLLALAFHRRFRLRRK